MRTEPLKAALDEGGYDIIFGGARRDEEKSRAKERIVSVRSAGHAWEPRQQRPELWRLYNTRLGPGQTARVFPAVQLDRDRHLDLRAAHTSSSPRSITPRPGRWSNAAAPSSWSTTRAGCAFARRADVETAAVRFRTLGCWPVTGAIESEATDLRSVVARRCGASSSERQGRISDGEDGGSLEAEEARGLFLTWARRIAVVGGGPGVLGPGPSKMEAAPTRQAPGERKPRRAPHDLLCAQEDRGVDHGAVDRGRATGAPRGENALRPGDVVVARTKTVHRRRDLRRMDQKLAGEPEFAGVRRVGANEIGILDARRNAVDRRGASGQSARKDELRARRGERGARVSRAQVSGKIDGAEGDARRKRPQSAAPRPVLARSR